ncbi:MAG: DUF2341 domain-containing protein [archaeon]
MAITDFNRKKKLDVEDVTDQPTISRAVPLKITSGDDSTTGTGEIVLDWSNISSESDIGIYDENDNLLDYYFESFDDTVEEAVVWVFRDWVQDGSTQLQVTYGNGPSDQSVSASTVFDKESGLEAGYLFNETSGDLLDVTSNGNDGTVHGASQGESGIVGGAYSFDGSDDYVDIPDNFGFLDGSSSFTLIGWVDIVADPNDDAGHILSFAGENEVYFQSKNVDTGTPGLQIWTDNENVYVKGPNKKDGEGWFHAAVIYDKSANEVRLHIDSTLVDTLDSAPNIDTRNDSSTIGSRDTYNRSHHGSLDDIRIYSSVVGSKDIDGLYSATKSSPDFFSQQSAEEIILYKVSGTVEEEGSPVERTVRLYKRSSGELVEETTSDGGTGEFAFTGMKNNDEHYVVALDDISDETDYNALIYDRIVPKEV